MFKIEKEEFVNKTFRLNKKMIDKMQSICERKNISMNKLVVLCVEYALENFEEELE